MSILGNVAGLGAVQPDWAQTDETRVDYIRNKPDFSGTDAQLQRALTLAEEALSTKGGTMAGNVSMGGNRLTDLAAPQEAADAATKAYVDEMAASARYLNVVLNASAWTGEEGGPYTQRLYCAGITDEDRPHFGLLYSGTRQEQLLQKQDWGKVDDLETEMDYLVFTCLEEKPAVNLTVQLELRRGADAGEAEALLILGDPLGSDVQAEIDGQSYGVENATINSGPTETTYDFTVY